MKYHTFKRDALNNRCRECINQSYGLKLGRKDCQYRLYPDTCRGCGKIVNIVEDIEPLSRWKIWLVKE